MLDTRFEDDMAEVSGGGGYLLLCAERKRAFLEGAGPFPLTDVRGITASGDSLVLATPTGDVPIRFEGADPAVLAGAAKTLADCAARWR